MAKLFDALILSNVEVAHKIFRMTLEAPELSENSKAGQFIQVKISDEFTLRRPFGIASTSYGLVKLFYRIVGNGTKILASKNPGEYLNILGALGNNFSTKIIGKILLVGGGIGLAPLLNVSEKNSEVDVLIGGRTKDEIFFWREEFCSTAKRIFFTTDDGSYGRCGFVTDLLSEILVSENYSAIFTCGPEIMMQNVSQLAHSHNIFCEVSLERRMACGLGACLSCSIETHNGRKKICKDGPIFNALEIF